MPNMKCLGSVFLVNVIPGTRPNMFCNFPTDSPEVQECRRQWRNIYHRKYTFTLSILVNILNICYRRIILHMRKLMHGDPEHCSVTFCCFHSLTSVFFIAIHPALSVKSKSMAALDHLAALQINKTHLPRSVVIEWCPRWKNRVHRLMSWCRYRNSPITHNICTDSKHV